MTNRIGQQIGIYDMAALQCKGNEQILLPLVEEVGSEAGVSSLLDHIGPGLTELLMWMCKAISHIYMGFAK